MVRTHCYHHQQQQLSVISAVSRGVASNFCLGSPNRVFRQVVSMKPQQSWVPAASELCHPICENVTSLMVTRELGPLDLLGQLAPRCLVAAISVSTGC